MIYLLLKFTLNCSHFMFKFFILFNHFYNIAFVSPEIDLVSVCLLWILYALCYWLKVTHSAQLFSLCNLLYVCDCYCKTHFLCLCLFLSCSIQFTWSIHYVSNNLHCSVCIEIKWVSFRKRERDSEIYIIHTSHSMHQQLAVFRWLPVTIKHRAGSIVYMRCDCDLTIKYKTRFFVLDVLVVVVPLFYISIDWHRTDE